MALTMTRTRTQTTLTRLAKLLANLNGELEFVEWLLVELPDHRVVLTVRRESLAANRDAVADTLRQFDPGMAVDAWNLLGKNGRAARFERTSRSWRVVTREPESSRYTELSFAGIKVQQQTPRPREVPSATLRIIKFFSMTKP